MPNRDPAGRPDASPAGQDAFLHVLTVQNSQGQSANLRAALEVGGYTVTEAWNGEDAIALLGSTPVHLVVSDIVMQGPLDGYELCRRIKRDHPDLPVILLTSLSDPLEIVHVLEAGADNFITTPCTPDQVLERIGAHLFAGGAGSTRRARSRAPLRLMGRELGVIPEPARVLNLLATTFGDAVTRNRELERREGEISRAGERLAGMYDTVVALHQCRTEQEIVDTALDGAIRLPRVRAAWVSLMDPDGSFHAAGSRDLPAALSAPGALEGDCRCRTMLRTGELSSVTNILECERIARLGAAAAQGRFHASVPLHCGDEPLGVLNLLGEEELFDEDDRAVLYGIGSQIGFAIERARTWRRLEERVEERAQALQESEERYRTLVDEVNDGIYTLDADGVFTFANPALARIHGLDDPSELLGRPFADFVPPEIRDEHRADFHARMSEDEAPPFVTSPIMKKDGSRAIVEIRPAVIVREGGVVGTRGVVRDVTQRVRAEEALRLSDSILRRIGNLVLVADREGTITYASPSVEALLGYLPEELLGDGWWRLAWEHPVEGERERAEVARRAGDPSLPDPPPVERPVRARDGSTHWILWQESKGPEGHFIGVGHDVTERRRLQEQFLQAQKMEAVGRLAGGVAHDFNNVLTSILITTDLMLPDLPGGQAREDVLAIRTAAKRAASLTRQLLAFSRKQVLNPEVVSLNDLVSGVADMLGSLLGEDITVEVLLAAGLGNVEIDPSQMEQAIMNLAVNARDAMPRGGRLLLETRNVDLGEDFVQAHPGARPGRHVVLSVTDTGFGMDRETMQHIFEPFFTTKPVGKGTGLGLATVHGIVNQSGGHVWVYSEPGRGTTFKIYLPRVDAAAERAPAHAGEPTLPGGSETILLVEDDEAVRRTAERVLRQMGYDVLTAAGSEEALSVMSSLESRAVHLLIADVVMPGFTGPELADWMVRVRPALRVLFVSGYSDEVIARQGLLGQGRPFLEKPFTVEALLKKVREVLDS